MYTLKQQADGTYALDTQDSFKQNPYEFEAYSPTQRTELVGGTTLGAQTQKIMGRELPGTIQTQVDPKTGEVKTVREGAGEVEIQPQSITSLDTATGQATMPTTDPFAKVGKILSMTQRQQSADFDMDRYAGLIQNQQDLMKRQQDIGLLTSGLNAYAAYKYGGKALTSMTGPTTALKSVVATPIGSSTVGGVGIAGAAGYGLGQVIGAKEEESVGMGAGAAIGTAVAGPVGGVIGGAIGGVVGGVFGCFLPDTKITMADGSEKEIINIDLKDNIKVGGFVFATGKFLVNNLFDYKGIKVSGEHLVNENGKWLKVKDSKFSKSLGNDEHIVYTLGSENRRILINNILFTDYFDFEEQKTLLAA